MLSRSSLAFHPTAPLLAAVGRGFESIYLWEYDLAALLVAAPAVEAVRYATAKIVLLGESGVGKTGLGWRLSQGTYKDHSSTHGQQLWPLTQLAATRSDGTECEAILWDLAGRAGLSVGSYALFAGC